MENLILNNEKTNIVFFDSLDEIVCFLNALNSKKIMLLTDNILGSIYLNKILELLKDTDIRLFTHIVKSGEEHKSIYNVLDIVEDLHKNDFSRSDYIVALGGGVLCDMIALAANLYMRGMKLILIPTTLLAMVDAAIGGKTAVNSKHGKNLIGTFYQADDILIYKGFLKSLDGTDISCGIAEIIKYACISEEYIIELLKKSIKVQNSKHIIDYNKIDLLLKECIKIKLKIIQNDLYDKGIRNVLNLGHTIGHSIEKKSNYSIPHGAAVAIGLSFIGKLCLDKGIAKSESYNTLIECLKCYMLKTDLPFDIDELIPYILRDKKNSGEKQTLILFEDFGKCRIEKINKNLLYKYLTE